MAVVIAVYYIMCILVCDWMPKNHYLCSYSSYSYIPHASIFLGGMLLDPLPLACYAC